MLGVFADAQRRGLVGPGPLEPQIDHALALGQAVEAVHGRVPGVALDLGSGGGLPGLVVAVAWPTSRWVLLDRRARSTAFLTEAVAVLGLGERVSVREDRAEAAGRDEVLRGAFELVTARGFAGPAVTAECGAPFLQVGGHLVVSEPPGSGGERWPADALELLGLALETVVRRAAATFAVLIQRMACPDVYPRRAGVPAKRPLFPNPAVDVSRETKPGT